jgi:FTR1 family protein
MLPTFVIGLREGLEAALIVGIIAAFLGQQGRKDALRQVWIGTAAAVAICIGVAIALQVISSDLPQRQQEGLETVVGALAIGMVTYMIIFMRKHARSMKKDLQGATASALAEGSARALVLMAFLAVLREGFETAVFRWPRSTPPATPARPGWARSSARPTSPRRAATDSPPSPPTPTSGWPVPSTTAEPISCAAATPLPTASIRRPGPCSAACSSSRS